MANKSLPIHEYYRLIVQGARDHALIFIDPEGRITTWNPGAERITGYSESDIAGQHYSVLYPEADRMSRVPETELEMAQRNGTTDDTRCLLKKDGSEFWADGTTTAVRGEGEELLGFTKVIRDASERRNLEKTLELTNDELQRFAYTVSHDLQEPLRTVRSYAELLSRRYKGQLDTDADEFIHFMVDAASRMNQLLRDILAYSQAGSNKSRLEPTQTVSVLQWAIMNVDVLLKETGGTITYDPLPIVLTDQTQLAQVFQNLITNSLKFRSEEPPKIHVTAEKSEDQFWRFSVQDNGIGIDPQFHERVFGVFKRLHTKEIPGTGIGLAICRRIIERHGGKMWLSSVLGSGTTVLFTLPSSE